MPVSTLERARGGDDVAFDELTRPFRRELHVHCYRLLGSVADADDLLQETLTAAWRALGDLAEPAALRAWLYRIATTRCLNAIRADKRRPPPAPEPPFAVPAPNDHDELTWLQPYPDAWLDDLGDPATVVEQTQGVRLAFVAALQRLPPRQAAALVLVDVLHFAREEAAGMLATSDVALKGVLQRARRALDAEPGSTPADPDEDAVARRFADAFVADDVDAMVALLTDDVWLAMPPAPHVYLGRAAATGFLAAQGAARAATVVGAAPLRAGGRPAFLLRWRHGSASLLAVGVRDGAVAEVTHVVTGLPASITG